MIMDSRSTEYHNEYYHNRRATRDNRASRSKAKEKRRSDFIERFPNYFELLQYLPERDRRIILGFYLEGRSLSEIAQFLGISKQRVHSLKDRAVENITDYYNNCK